MEKTMKQEVEELKQEIARLQPASHICAFYPDREPVPERAEYVFASCSTGAEPPSLLRQVGYLSGRNRKVLRH